MAISLLSEDLAQPLEQLNDSLSQGIQSYQQSLSQLMAFMHQVLPDTSISYTFGDWAMLVQIYETAGMESELHTSLEALVSKGQSEIALIQRAGGEITPNETALSAVFMGIQYYQENGQEERAQELTKWLEQIVEGM